MKEEKIIGGLFFFLSFVIICGGFYEVSQLEYGTHKVDCFDKNGNKIKDLKCEKVVGWEDSVVILTLTFAISIGFGAMGYNIYTSELL